MQELKFLHSSRRLILIDICMKFREDSFRGFQVTEQTRFVTDGQTDGRTDRRTDRRTAGKTICLQTLKGGDIKIFHLKTYNISIKSWTIRLAIQHNESVDIHV